MPHTTFFLSSYPGKYNAHRNRHERIEIVILLQDDRLTIATHLIRYLT